MHSHVPTSSSIIPRRHGRVRFAVAVSARDRTVLSHFLPANSAGPPSSLAPTSVSPGHHPRPDSPGLLVRFATLATAPTVSKLPAATTSGWEGGMEGNIIAPRQRPSLPAGRDGTTLSWRPAVGLHPQTHPRQHGRLVYPASIPSASLSLSRPRTRAGRLAHAGFRKG